jgi:hypothetical protein
MLRNKLLGTATAAALIGTLGMAPAAVAAPGGSAAPTAVVPMSSHEAAPVPVEGVLPDGTAFTGTISGLTAEVVDGVVNLTGTLTGTLADGTAITQDFTAPITELSTPDSQPGGCQILFLDLGPIFLDLLGLQVDLSPIELDITAVPGAGNLLGNLLCAVTGLFDGPGNPLNAITNLLNRLLGGLGLAA